MKKPQDLTKVATAVFYGFLAALITPVANAADFTDDYIKRGEFEFAAKSAYDNGKYEKSEELCLKSLSFCEDRKLPSQSISKLNSLLLSCDQTGHYSICSAACGRMLKLIEEADRVAMDLYAIQIDSLVEEGKMKEALAAADEFKAKCTKSRWGGLNLSSRAQAEKVALLYRTGQKAQADELLLEAQMENLNHVRGRRFTRLSRSASVKSPSQSVMKDKIIQESAIFPSTMSLFEAATICKERQQTTKAMDLFKAAVTCKSYELDSSYGNSNWSKEDFARRKAALALIEIYEQQNQAAKAAELCEYILDRIPDSPGGRWSNIKVNEHLIKNLNLQNKTDAGTAGLHKVLAQLAKEAEIPSRGSRPIYPGQRVQVGNFDFRVKLCGASKLFAQTLDMSKQLRAQNKLSEAQSLMEHLIAVPGKEFSAVTGADQWLEELALIYIAQKNFSKAKETLFRVLAPLIPLQMARNDDELNQALLVINSANYFALSGGVELTGYDPAYEFNKFNKRLDLLQSCYLAGNDRGTAAKFYKQYALLVETQLADLNPRKAQRLDYVAERLALQCKDPSAMSYRKKAADAAVKVLENERERFINGIQENKQAFDILQVLKNYQQALQQSNQVAQASELGKSISKYELASKSGQLNGKTLEPVKFEAQMTHYCGSDPMLGKLKLERLQKGRELLQRLVELADRQHLR